MRKKFPVNLKLCLNYEYQKKNSPRQKLKAFKILIKTILLFQIDRLQSNHYIKISYLIKFMINILKLNNEIQLNFFKNDKISNFKMTELNRIK